MQNIDKKAHKSECENIKRLFIKAICYTIVVHILASKPHIDCNLLIVLINLTSFLGNCSKIGWSCQLWFYISQNFLYFMRQICKKEIFLLCIWMVTSSNFLYLGIKITAEIYQKLVNWNLRAILKEIYGCMFKKLKIFCLGFAYSKI